MAIERAERAAEEAKNVPPTNYKSDLLALLRTYLNDPTNVRSAAISQPEITTVSGTRVYAACVRFNAKRGGDGQYAGVKDTLAVFSAGKLDRLVELGGTVGAEEAERNKPLRDFFAAASYQAFPELERLTR